MKSMALTAEKVKEVGKAVGADLVGIASIDRFEGAPLEMHPASILPEAESVIVLAFRILRGALRGIEEGTYFAAYPSMCYAGINLNFAPKALYDLSRFIEDHGYEAVPYQNVIIDVSVDARHGTPKDRKPVAPGRAAPDVLLKDSSNCNRAWGNRLFKSLPHTSIWSSPKACSDHH
jgi:hypothetical protein